MFFSDVYSFPMFSVFYQLYSSIWCTTNIIWETIAHLRSLPPWSFLQPFWQVVNYADSRGRGVVGKNLDLCQISLFLKVVESMCQSFIIFWFKVFWKQILLNQLITNKISRKLLFFRNLKVVWRRWPGNTGELLDHFCTICAKFYCSFGTLLFVVGYPIAWLCTLHNDFWTMENQVRSFTLLHITYVQSIQHVQLLRHVQLILLLLLEVWHVITCKLCTVQ